jgi:predicted ATP-grasp superfamily ATP-dependent carboligase
MTAKSGSILVVIGFAEALSAAEVVWSLVDSGCQVVAFSRKGRRSALRHSRYVTVRDVTAPEKDYQKTMIELLALLESCHKGTAHYHVLLPLDDASVWLYNQIKPVSDWILAGPTGKCAELALNKQLQVEAAKAAGFNVPKTSIVSTMKELSSCVSQFPIILRPANAVSIDGLRFRKGRNSICSDEGELNSARSAWAGNGPLLVQPFLDGNGEGVFGLATEKGVILWSGHRRLRMMNPHGSGSSACVSQTIPDSVKLPVETFIKSSGWRGMFMVELLRTSDEKLWFVEFNGRAWGSMALSRRQSIEYPAWSVRLAIDPKIAPDVGKPVFEEVVCRNLGREIMHVLFVLRGPKSKAIQRWPSFWKTFFGLFYFPFKTSLYNWRKDDWRVFFNDCWYTIRDQIFKKEN